MQKSARILIIGLDGATWDVLGPWMADGSLPNLSKLRQNGSGGTLLSTIPPITAAAWSTFMTGKRPGKHGVFHFIKLFESSSNATERPELVNASSLKSSTLWDILGHYEKKIALINVPMTYPPRPVNGYMITGLLTPKHASVFTYPASLSAELDDYIIDLDRFADKKPFYDDDYDAQTTAPTLALINEFREMMEKRARATLSLMSSKPWDLFMVVFTGTDRMGHYLWDYHRSPNKNDDPATQELCRSVREYYIRLDEIVGQIIERAGNDVTVVVMSDHGMGPPPYKRFHCSNWLAQQGWLSTKSRRKDLSNLETLLKNIGLPRDRLGKIIGRIPGLMKSQVVRNAAQNRSAFVDVEQSQVYGVSIFYNIMGLRINPNLSGEKRKNLCQEISQGLQNIIDPETGEKIVDYVIPGNDYYYGPYAENIPDLIACLRPEYYCNHHLGHYSSLITGFQAGSGPAKHRNEGIFIFFGPNILSNPEAIPGVHIEDIAPTILHLLNLPVPSDMDGQVVTKILEPTHLEARPVRYSQPIGYWPTENEAVFSSEVMSEEDEEQIRDRLQALGYFE